jgi:branched-chain amino acid transport system substrate-binding protein
MKSWHWWLLVGFIMFGTLHSKDQRIGLTGLSTFDQPNSIRIGAPISYSTGDKYFNTGSDIVNAWTLFAEWINIERGGIKYNGSNVSVNIIYMEDFSDSDYVRHATRHMIDDYEVNFMLGPYSTGLTMAASEVTLNSSMIMMAGTALPTNQTTENNFTFYTLPTDKSALASTFRVFVENGGVDVGVIVDSDVDRCRLGDVMAAAAREGITVASYTKIDPNSPNNSQTLTAILQDFKSNDIKTVLGCSFESLCLNVRC